jgi:steroid delta-isomerase-like uncharacterized protein
MDRGSAEALIHDLIAALNAHALDRAASFVAGDYRGVDLSRSRRCHGPEQVRQSWQEWGQAFPDFDLAVREIIIGEEQVTVLWTLDGTHQGAFLHVPATQRPVHITGVSLLRLREARITRGMHLWDMAGMLRTMKLLPDLPGPPRDALHTRWPA